MRILIIFQYYPPETVGSGVFGHQLAKWLQSKGHTVTVLTAFPNYPKRIVFPEYRRRLRQVEQLDGIRVIRTWIFANPSESYISRILNWGSFCASSWILGKSLVGPQDVVYTICPPLPLGEVGLKYGKKLKCPVVTNVQDIYPKIAIELGILTHPKLIAFFERMEKKVYAGSTRIIGISGGFKSHFQSCGVSPEKIDVVANWADPEGFVERSVDTPMRAEAGFNSDDIVVLYSGGHTHNSCLESFVDAAAKSTDPRIKFVLSGDGPTKAGLIEKANILNLKNIQFLPFVDLERYPEWLASADISVVALHVNASLASVPSKIFKQMAAGRPILAITKSGNELERMIHAGNCGVVVDPDTPDEIVAAILAMADDREAREQMGRNGRNYFMDHFTITRCAAQIESSLSQAVAGG